MTGRGWRLPEAYVQFLSVPRIASMALALPDGRIHATPVKMAFDSDAGVAVVLTAGGSVKARRIHSAESPVRVALTEHSSTLWASLEGPASVSAGASRIEWARDLYARRFGTRDAWGDVAVEVTVDKALYGS